jgi:heme/copper-type cytochrome/quinol oxidase subunit 2
MFDIAYADGAVNGPTRPEVAVGTRVTLLVTSDVDDDVYLHGYNVKAAVGLDTAAVIEFLADEPGTYELELLDADVSLLEIAVR